MWQLVFLWSKCLKIKLCLATFESPYKHERNCVKKFSSAGQCSYLSICKRKTMYPTALICNFLKDAKVQLAFPFINGFVYPVWTRITIHNVTRLVTWYTFDLIVCDILFTNAYMHFKGWYIKNVTWYVNESFLFYLISSYSYRLLYKGPHTSICFHSLKQKAPLSKTLLHLYYIVQNETPINRQYVNHYIKKPDFVKIAHSCLKIIEEYLNSFFIILLERKYMIKLRLIFF